ncbi:hypothetical protein [Desulforapulum autotrophicum]|nr:hypothetical protein [Desulforapulum autotrophicum]
MLVVFFMVLAGLIFKFVGDLRSESIKKHAEQIEQEKRKAEFVATIEEQYKQMKKLYQEGEYDQVIKVIKVFSDHGKSDYKDLPEIKREIRRLHLEKKLDFIPKINLEAHMNFLKKEGIEKDTSTQVFIRTPRYGQYFYPSDFPIQLEGSALSLNGDFSDDIIWTSSINGNLGTGKSLSVRLSFGDHKIIATGTNGITTGTMGTLIHVVTEPEFMKKHRRN